MDKNSISEISDYLKHNDTSLAIRRLLDTALDTKDNSLIREAIALSKLYNSNLSNSLEPLSESVYIKATDLLEKLTNVECDQQVQSINLIEANQISKQYSSGGFSLKATSLSVRNGEIIGVVGENGNGKTTLLRCLAGQLYINNGSINYNLLKLKDYYAIKNYVVFIPQRIPRWYGYLKDNLHFSASIAGIVGEENELMVEFMIERLGLSKFADLTWEQISSGYRTRFELARVLLQKPQLLILDEPLANLDINAQQTVLTDLKYMAKSSHNPMGVLLSSQQLHEVEKVADSVLLIKNGNCISNNVNKNITNEYVLEIESTISRDVLLSIFNEGDVQMKYNGGFYTINSTKHTVEEILEKVVNAKIPISYFRDITNSTKRYF